MMWDESSSQKGKTRIHRSFKPINVIRAIVQCFINARKLSDDEAIEKGSKMFCELAADLINKPINENLKKD